MLIRIDDACDGCESERKNAITLDGYLRRCLAYLRCSLPHVEGAVCSVQFLPGPMTTVRRLAPACCRPETREPLLSRVSSRLPGEAIITMNNPTKKVSPMPSEWG